VTNEDEETHHRDPLLAPEVGDDEGGMAAEFVDLPENEPGENDPPTVVERARAQAPPDG
jgi:hypothetical protein